MVKADPKRNYYADLEVAPSASTENIKQQFRKLARIYHPDRNPGREVEFVPKFQAIQAAHEILADPEQRAKYDADRRRLGYNLGPRPTPPRPGPTRPSYRQEYGSYFSQSSSQAPPQAPQPPRSNYYSPKTTAGYSGYSAYEASGKSGASSYTRFKPPTAARDSGSTDAGARAKAWQHFGPTSAGGTPPKTPETSRSRPGRQSSPEKASAANVHPGLGRSNTTRTPRRGGFDPNMPGEQWEPAAPKSSSYVFTKPRASSMDHLDAADGIQDPRMSRESSARAKSVSPKNRKESTPKRSQPTFEFPSSESESSSSNSSSGVPVNESTVKQNTQTYDFGNISKTPFSADQWSNKFSGAEAFAAPTSSFRQSSRSRVSPTRPVKPAKVAPPPPVSASRRPAMAPRKTQNVGGNSRSQSETEATLESQIKRPPVKFSPAEWAEKFKDPSFLYKPKPAVQPRAASMAARSGTRTRSMSRSHEILGASVNVDGPAPDPRAPKAPSPSHTADADAMEIDTPPHTTTSSTKGPRMVKVPVSRSEWQSPKSSNIPPSMSPLQHANTMPSAIPNHIPPPPPITASTQQQPLQSKPPKLEEPIPPSFNLSSIKDNLTGPSGAGIANLTELNSSLPFPSRPAPHHPQSTLSSLSPATFLEVPKAPVCPQPPTTARRLTNIQWKQYTAGMSAYMGEWFKFEAKILNHFASRHNDSAKFGSGTPSTSATRLIEAQGEPEGGLGSYLENRKRDRRVREAWNVANDRHELCLEEFCKAKERVRTEGFGTAANG